MFLSRNKTEWPAGTQTLGRGLSIVHAVSNGASTLTELGRAVGCTRSTTQRLASALLRQGWLRLNTSGRYVLGPQLSRLASQAQSGTPLSILCRPVLQDLADRTRDAIFLASREEDSFECLDRIDSRREAETRLRPGQRALLASSGLGQALLIDEDVEDWADQFAIAYGEGKSADAWIDAMHAHRARGCVFDFDVSEPGSRSVAVPLRDGHNTIVGAICLTAPSAFMGDARVRTLAPIVMHAAHEISAKLGWQPTAHAAE